MRRWDAPACFNPRDSRHREHVQAIVDRHVSTRATAASDRDLRDADVRVDVVVVSTLATAASDRDSEACSVTQVGVTPFQPARPRTAIATLSARSARARPLRSFNPCDRSQRSRRPAVGVAPSGRQCFNPRDRNQRSRRSGWEARAEALFQPARPAASGPRRRAFGTDASLKIRISTRATAASDRDLRRTKLARKTSRFNPRDRRQRLRPSGHVPFREVDVISTRATADSDRDVRHRRRPTHHFNPCGRRQPRDRGQRSRPSARARSRRGFNPRDRSQRSGPGTGGEARFNPRDRSQRSRPPPTTPNPVTLVSFQLL